MVFYVLDMDEWLKRGSLKRQHEEDASDFSEESEEVSDSNSSNRPATSVQITKTNDVKIRQY
jgi:hypothetical protein